MTDELVLKGPDLIGDPMEADVMALAPGQRREGPLVGADPAPEPPAASEGQAPSGAGGDSNSRDRRIDGTRATNLTRFKSNITTGAIAPFTLKRNPAWTNETD
jgi:hypothetical protein